MAIVDDHPMFRMGLAVAIGEMAGIEVVGEAEGADEVAGLVSSTAPDIVLLDVRLGDGSASRSTAGSPPTTPGSG